MAVDEFETIVSVESGVVRFTVRGEYSAVRLRALLERIAREAAAHSLPRILVESSGIPGGMSTIDKYQMGTTAAAELPRTLKIAVFDPAAAQDPFSETVARNRGTNLRTFATEAAALEWLRG